LLFREFLIGVTEFFRDPAAFEALCAIAIPAMLADNTGADVLRVWVPGCATGEEAYSIAIAMREAMGSQRGPKVKIFATDIDDRPRPRVVGVVRVGIHLLDEVSDGEPDDVLIGLEEVVRLRESAGQRGDEIARHARLLADD